MYTEHLSYIALNMADGLGPVTVNKLMGCFSSVSKILEATAEDLASLPFITSAKAESIVRAVHLVDPEKEEARALKMGIKIITFDDERYPKILREIHDPPMALYTVGDLEAFDFPGIAMVGTRSPSIYGKEQAEKIGYGIALNGLTVVSGMARGIDTASHVGALKASGRTIGVIGGAINCFYPQENRELARKVAKSKGLIISEFPLDLKPSKITFPKRNRIISGLSYVTLVVEAAVKSGSLITSDTALEQGRIVMALPGRVDVPTSLGCNKLIQDGAKLVVSADDVLDELGSLSLKYHANLKKEVVSSSSQSAPSFVNLSDEEKIIAKALPSEEIMIDSLIAETGIDAGRVNALLITLQMKRILKILPGGWVKRE